MINLVRGFTLFVLMATSKIQRRRSSSLLSSAFIQYPPRKAPHFRIGCYVMRYAAVLQTQRDGGLRQQLHEDGCGHSRQWREKQLAKYSYSPTATMATPPVLTSLVVVFSPRLLCSIICWSYFSSASVLSISRRGSRKNDLGAAYRSTSMLARCWIDGAIDEVISKGSREPRPGGNSQTGGRDNQCDHVSHWCLLLRKHPRAGGRSVGDHVRGWCCWRMVLKMAWSFQSEGSLLGVGCHGAERDDMMMWDMHEMWEGRWESGEKSG